MRKTIFLITIIALSIFLIGCSTEKAGQAVAIANAETDEFSTVFYTVQSEVTDVAIQAGNVKAKGIAYDNDFGKFSTNRKIALGHWGDLQKELMILKDRIEKTRDKELIVAYDKLIIKANDMDKTFGSLNSDWELLALAHGRYVGVTTDLIIATEALPGSMALVGAQAEQVSITVAAFK